jgi:hypothetical protein
MREAAVQTPFFASISNHCEDHVGARARGLPMDTTVHKQVRFATNSNPTASR